MLACQKRCSSNNIIEEITKLRRDLSSEDLETLQEIEARIKGQRTKFLEFLLQTYQQEQALHGQC